MNLHEVPALPERDGLPPPPKHQRLHAGARSGAAGSAEGQGWEFFSRAFAVQAAAQLHLHAQRSSTLPWAVALTT